METSPEREYTVIPFGRYPAFFRSLELIEKKPEWMDPKKPDEDRFQWKWVFDLELPNGELHTQWGYTGRFVGFTKDGSPSKARAWFIALNNGLPLDWAAKPKEVDHFPFLNQRCYIKLNDKKRDLTAGNVILEVLPYTSDEKPTQSAAQAAVEAGSADPLFPEEGAAKEAAGYPRRVLAASNTLKGKGITTEAIKARQAAIVGNDKQFKEQIPKDQRAVVEWFEGWAENFDQYDETGDIAF